jgi:uncharacterized protein YukE
MYTTSADDLARIANDLSQIAKQYTGGSQELDHQLTGLDATASHLIYGGAKPWTGLASEAFQGAWEERRSRLQQASQLLTLAAQHLTQFTRTIEDNLPTIRMDQQLMQGPSSHMLAPDDQSSILNGESQAQNAIIMALQALNSQLEELAYEVRDCPEEQDGNTPAWDEPLIGNRNHNDSNVPEGDNSENDNTKSENTEPVDGSGKVILAGSFASPEEEQQASRFTQRMGGGEFEGLGLQQGIDGIYTPEGSDEEIPVSLKDWSGTGKKRYMIGNINRNAAEIQEAGFKGAILDVDVPQWTSADMQNFVQNGPIKNMPSEGVYKSLIFNCSDGTVIVDANGVRIMR